MNPPETAASWSRRGWREDLRRLDYPADVVVGSVTGAALGQVAVALRRRSPLRRGRAR